MIQSVPSPSLEQAWDALQPYYYEGLGENQKLGSSEISLLPQAAELLAVSEDDSGSITHPLSHWMTNGIERLIKSSPEGTSLQRVASS